MSFESKPALKGPQSYFPSIEKTYGKPIEYWMSALDAMEGKKHVEMVEALKGSHKVGHGHANALVAYHRSKKK